MDAPLPTVEQTDQRLIIRLPRRVGGGLFFLLAFPAATLFWWFPILFLIGLFFPYGRFHSELTFSGPLWAKPIGNIFVFLFFGLFFLAGGRLIYGNIIGRFGHGEIHLWRGRIKTYERLGFLRLRAMRSIDTLIRLNVETFEYARKSNIENEMDLVAFFTDTKPFRLAHNYNREQLLAAAKHIQAALPQFGAAAKITVAGQVLLGPTGAVVGAATFAPQTILVPPPKRTRIKLYRPAEGGVRFTIPGIAWWAGMLLAIVVAPTLSYVLTLPSGPHGTNGLLDLFPRSQRGTVDVVVIMVIVVGTLLTVQVLRRATIVNATTKELTIKFGGFPGDRTRKWAVADIDRLEVEVRTGGKGGSTRSLTLFPKKGRRQRLFSMQSEKKLQWMRAELSAAIWPHVSPQRESAATKPVRNLKDEAVERRFFGILFAGFACIFVIIGWWCAIAQDHRLRHGRPVQATVIRLEMVARSSRNGTTGYQRVLHYQYTAAGRPYQSTEFFPAGMSGQVETNLRDAFFDSLHGRSIIPAWYVDDEPSRAYLIHERLFSSYGMILFANVFFLAGLVVALPPTEETQSSFELAEARRRRFITLTWLIMGIAAIGHYLLQWPTQWHGDFLFVVPIWLLISIAFTVWWRVFP